MTPALRRKCSSCTGPFPFLVEAAPFFVSGQRRHAQPEAACPCAAHPKTFIRRPDVASSAASCPDEASTELLARQKAPARQADDGVRGSRAMSIATTPHYKRHLRACGEVGSPGDASAGAHDDDPTRALDPVRHFLAGLTKRRTQMRIS